MCSVNVALFNLRRHVQIEIQIRLRFQTALLISQMG